MTRTLSNPEQYSKLWMKESQFLESHGIYAQLSKLVPTGKVLEFGCGAGFGTYHLATNHEVMCLESNRHLIEEATKHFSNTGVNVTIQKCDFFDLTAEDKERIAAFKPTIIVGWFIGSSGHDIYKHTEDESDEEYKSKLYRERIEDILVSPDVCLESVEYIHLVNRGGMVIGFSEEEQFQDIKHDYEKYVFSNVGFEVIEAKNIHWPREGSTFEYGKAPNPELIKGESVPIINTLLAKRAR